MTATVHAPDLLSDEVVPGQPFETPAPPFKTQRKNFKGNKKRSPMGFCSMFSPTAYQGTASSSLSSHSDKITTNRFAALDTDFGEAEAD